MTVGDHQYAHRGPEWASRIPSHWAVKPLFAIGRERRMKNTGLAEQNLLSLSYGRIIQKDINAIDGLLPGSFETYQIVEPNDEIFRFTDLQNDHRSLRSARVQERGIITSAYTAFTPRDIDSRYFDYLMRSYDLSKVFYGMGGGIRQSLNFDEVRRLPVLVPPLPEQRAIADLLDQETAKIDTLINKQNEMIDLLRERRRQMYVQVLLRQQSDFPTETSWYGTPPSTWRVDKLGRHTSITKGSTPSRDEPRYWDDGHFPWLNSSYANLDEVNESHDFVTRKALDECHLPVIGEGTVLVGITGEGRTRGMATLLKMTATINQHLAAVTPDARYWDSRYLTLLLRAAYDELREIGHDEGTTRSAITLGDLSSFVVPCPPLVEQKLLASEMDRQIARIDALTYKAEDLVALARERRAALITAAVTGQIDVLERVS